MSEKSIVEPLSGVEVVEAIKYKVAEQLRRDCFLSMNMAYESFEATIHIAIKLKDIGHSPEIVKTIKVAEGPAIPASFADPEEASRVHTEESEDGFEAMPANEIRVETEQPVPVAVEGTDGKVEIKRIKYQGKLPRTTPNPASGVAAAVKLPAAKED